MNDLPVLRPGDSVEIIAPASRCADSQLEALRELVESWQLHCIIQEDIFGKDLLCANTDEARWKHLQHALQNRNSKAIICARGGYGAMRLIPYLKTMQPPASPKLFVGMSDITCLQLFLQQHWHWPTIHGAAAPDRFSPESIAALKSLLFAEVQSVEFKQLVPLNHYAQEHTVIESTITGGNLAIVQSGIGTCWEIDGQNKLILLEEVGERGYRIDRMLQHLQQTGLFDRAAAIILGDFLGGDEPNGSSLVNAVLQRFAKACTIPVVRLQGVGHGATNYPIPFATPVRLQLGSETSLICFR